MNMNNEDLGYNLNKDIYYIKNDIVAKQKNGNYCKYSRLAKSITVTNISYEKYVDYWMGVLKNRKVPEDKLKLVREIIQDKFNNDLTDLEVMINLELKSTDSQNDKDKIIKDIIAKSKEVA